MRPCRQQHHFRTSHGRLSTYLGIPRGAVSSENNEPIVKGAKIFR